MDEELDDSKGRAKEAAGDLSDDGRLKREGQIDRAGTRMKEILEEARGKLDDAVDKLDVERARARTKEVIEEAKDKIDEALGTLKSRLRSRD
jgi:uncharacterized protein YjbJ (UPF0337 family)